MVSTGWYLKNIAILSLAVLLYLEFSGVYTGRLIIHPLLLTGQLTVLTGGLIEIAHYLILRRTNDNIAKPTSLETARGLYKFVRHPMYFGDLLILTGFLLMITTPAALALASLGLYGIARQVPIEDAELQDHFGQNAQAWRQSTRAVIPFIW